MNCLQTLLGEPKYILLITSMSFQHIVLFKFKEDADLAAIGAACDALRQIATVRSVKHGSNVSARSQVQSNGV